MQYRKEIDGLRAIAVLPVILFHAGFQAFGGGFVGVDVFFVISGFLITSILINDLENGMFSIAKFYERRIRRILPALCIVVFSSLPIVWFWLPLDEMQEFGKELLSVSIFVSNIRFWRQSGYFDTASEFKPLIHTWSLAVEEQFYLLFPIFLMLIWRFGKRTIVGALIIVFVISLSVAQWAAYKNPAFAFYMLPTRAWELSIGALAAFFCNGKETVPNSSWYNNIGSLFGFLLIVYSIFAFGRDTPFPSVYTLIPTIGAALIIVLANPKTLIGRLLGSRCIVGIGLLSYSAYLWHQPMFAFARIISYEAPTNWLILALTLGVFAFAYLSWRYVERPFRNGNIFSRKQIFRYATIATLCFVLIGAIGKHGGHLQEYRMSKAQIATLNQSQMVLNSECDNVEGRHELLPSDACAYYGRNVTWAVLGDSHAGVLAYALAGDLKIQDIGVKQLSRNGCGPSYDFQVPKTSCAEWTDAAVAYLDQTPSIKTVIVTYRLNAALFGSDQMITYPDLPNSIQEDRRIQTWESYVKLLRHLQQSGKKVVAVIQVPELRKLVGDLIFRAGGELDSVAGIPSSWWKRRNSFVIDRLNTLPKGVEVVDPSDLFCDFDSCYAIRNGVALYYDENHLSLAGAKVLSGYILKSLNK